MQDKGQPLSVQPWGSDGDRRRYWLIEGLDDTFFRIYRENDPKLIKRTWWSVARDIESANRLADKLREDGSQLAKQLASGIAQAVPRWEAGDEVRNQLTKIIVADDLQKRRRREYRQMRKAQFVRPEPGFSIYEGRTRGKRTRYTYSDDEDVDTDEPSSKRSRQSGISTPIEHNGPTITASGRQVKARSGGVYGESLLSGQRASIDEGISETENNRLRTRSGRASRPVHSSSINGFDGGDDIVDSDVPSEEWDSDQNEDDDVDENLADIDEDDNEDMSDGGMDEDDHEIAPSSKTITIKLGEETRAKLERSRDVSGQHSVTEPKAIVSQDADTISLAQRSTIPGFPALENTFTGSTAGPQAGPLKAEDRSIQQTPTPPLSDFQQSLPGSANTTF